jgi:hypothetical protein
MRFTRRLYQGEAQYLLGSMETIERLYDTLLKFPSFDEARFFSLSDHQKAVESGDAEKAAFHLIFDAYNWLKFFWYTNLYKASKLAEGLIDAYNKQNHLVWVILTRSLVEYSAVFYYYQSKTKQFEISGPSFKGSQLKGFEDLMIQYAHGTRFNWNDLFSGDLDSLAKTYAAVQGAPSAINVLTAVAHLSKRDQRFKQLEITYAMLSDFAHPNMASHTAVVDMPQHQSSMHHCRMTLNPDRLRGEFLLMATLPSVVLALGNALEVLIESAQLLKRWLTMFDINERVSIDFAA